MSYYPGDEIESIRYQLRQRLKYLSKEQIKIYRKRLKQLKQNGKDSKKRQTGN